MKMKIKKTFQFSFLILLLQWTIIGTDLIQSQSETGKATIKTNLKQFIMPRIESSSTEVVYSNPLPIAIHNMPLVPQPVCPCAATVVCKPCDVIARLDPIASSNIECPCAPNKCPSCPPLSLIHDISSRKALQDQQLAVNLRGLTNRMTKYFDMLIKYSSDVVKYEDQARNEAKNMEEASLKAMIARRNMFNTSEKARFIAKAGIVEGRPCGGIDCASDGMMGFFPDKVFPEEVDSIKGIMGNEFSTNLSESESLEKFGRDSSSSGTIDVEMIGNAVEGIKNNLNVNIPQNSNSATDVGNKPRMKINLDNVSDAGSSQGNQMSLNASVLHIFYSQNFAEDSHNPYNSRPYQPYRPVDVVLWYMAYFQFIIIIICVLILIATIVAFWKVPWKRGYRCRCGERTKWFLKALAYEILLPFVIVDYAMKAFFHCLDFIFPDTKLEDNKLLEEEPQEKKKKKFIENKDEEKK